MKHMVKFTALVCCSLAAASLFADPATGWKQTAGGTYNYNDAANWVGGNVNGIFGSDLTLAGAQTITFAADTSLAGGLNIAYAGNYAMTFKSSDDSTKTLTLGGDITSSMSGSSAAVVTFDSSLAIDLDNSGRTITASAANGFLDIKAAIANGALTIAGDKNLKLAGANTYAGGTTIAGSTYVYVNSATAFGTGDVSINAVLHLCADANLTMTANNTFYMNADRFAYNSGKTLDIGTGDFVATNSFQFWAEGDALTIHGKIVDKDGNLAPWKLKKWGSKKLYTYSDAVMSEGGKFEIGNGEWYFNGAISGTGFAVDASSANGGTQHFRLQSANTFQGTLSITGGSLYVYAGDAGAIPNGSQVSIGAGTYFIGNGKSNYISSLMANNGVTTDSKGTLCFNSNDSGDIDLTDYPDLVLGSRGGARTYSGTITWPDINPLRLGGGGDSFTFSVNNAVPSDRDLELVGKVRFTAASDTAKKLVVTPGGMLILEGPNGALPNAMVEVRGGSLQINSNSGAGCYRIATLHLFGVGFEYIGNSKSDTLDTIGKLIFDVRDPAFGVIGGVCHLNLKSGGKTAEIHANELIRNNDMVWRMTGNKSNNRLLIGGADGANTVQFTVGDGTAIIDQLVGGGGAAGTTTISVYPFGFADCDSYYDSLVTYDAATGFRALDYETEYATSITSGTTSSDNVRLPVGTTAEITSDTTVNSLFLQGSEPNKGTTQTSGEGKLSLTSGVLVMGYHRNNHPDINTPIDFGNRQGVICFARGKGSQWRGALHGSAGAIFFQTSDSAGTGSGGTGLQMSGGNGYTLGDSDITGDIIVHGNIASSVGNIFPNGADRPGNMYVNGYCNVGGKYNGIYGIGMFWRDNSTVEVGSLDSEGDSDGGLLNNTTLIKTGTGRQRIGGISEHTGATTVSAGTLQVDGAFTQSAVTVAEGATLAGCGTFGKAVTLAAGAKLEAGSKKVEDQVMNLDAGLKLDGDATLNLVYKDNLTVGGITLGGALPEGKKITVNVVLGAGEKLKSKQHVIVESTEQLNIANFKRGENCGNLKLSADGKQLLMTVQSGLALYLR